MATRDATTLVALASRQMLRTCNTPSTSGRLPPELASAALLRSGRTGGRTQAGRTGGVAGGTQAASFSSSALRGVESGTARAASGDNQWRFRSSVEGNGDLQRLRSALLAPDRLRLTTPMQYRDPAIPLPVVRSRRLTTGVEWRLLWMDAGTRLSTQAICLPLTPDQARPLPGVQRKVP
jgi:hypothetical protein